MDAPIVLLLSHTQETFCTERVAGALRARGAEPLRVDTDSFPGALRLSTELGSADPECGMLRLDGAPLRVRSVWLWRLWEARVDPRMDPRHRAAARAESMTALRGLLDQLDSVPWIDPIEANQIAGNKTRQLRLAQREGLVIPETLITNDPDEARRFFARHGGRVIAKMQTTLRYGMEGGGGLPTRLLRREDLDALDGLRHCPMIFQRYIEKAWELRVAWVDGRAFVGALDGKKCGTDWRYESSAAWEPHSLPEGVRSALARLMSALGLRQGAIDLIVTPQGEYVFLEVNPSGEWGMLEAELSLPIAAALADALLV
jgi:glutathione synthase/RimK-type ligase-like ATP-grasp enzyme